MVHFFKAFGNNSGFRFKLFSKNQGVFSVKTYRFDASTSSATDAQRPVVERWFLSGVEGSRNDQHRNIPFICTLFFIGFVVCTSCENHSSKTTATGNISDSSLFNFTTTIQYAKGFSIEKKGSWKQITVLDPWKGDTLGCYALIAKNTEIPTGLKKGCIIVRIPISTIAILSSTHVGELTILGLRDNIKGVSNGDQLWDSILSRRFKQGEVVEVDHQMTNNVEQILALSPDLVMKSGFENVRNEDARLTEAGIPIAYNMEWMESDMLARAEWIKFVSAFFGKEQLADSLFNGIVRRYNEVKQLAASQPKQTVLFNMNYKGTWYLPGAKSYAAAMARDAGAVYAVQGNDRGSMPVNFEQVLDAHANDNIWLNVEARSLDALGKADERYKLFKAYKTGQVYNYDKRVNAAGGNDYWESGAVHPDVLLKDEVKILHPNLLPGYEMVYWRKLK
jgi:iron complex transport system substrate-binding protein